MTHSEHEDGCLCDRDPLADHEITADHDLPAAIGGVKGERKPRRPKPRSDKTAVGEDD